MFLRELDGRYAGQIREFPAEIGEALVASGRAVNPYAEEQRVTVPAVRAQGPPVPAIQAEKPAGKSGKAGRK